MRARNQIIAYLLLITMILTFLAAGCSHRRKSTVVTINEKKLYLEDFLYEIYLVEQDGNQLEKYRDKLGFDYWDYTYNGVTMRELAKSSVMASTVMYEILSDQAEKNGINLTENELSDNEAAAKELIGHGNKDYFKKAGLTDKILIKDLNTRTLGDKYRKELIKAIPIDKAKVRSQINKSEYLSNAAYEQAVKDALQQEEIEQFETVYNKIKKNYDIIINFDYWDKITLGSVTVPENE